MILSSYVQAHFYVTINMGVIVYYCFVEQLFSSNCGFLLFEEVAN